MYRVAFAGERLGLLLDEDGVALAAEEDGEQHDAGEADARTATDDRARAVAMFGRHLAGADAERAADDARGYRGMLDGELAARRADGQRQGGRECAM